jgi:hypothetical protein
VRIVARINSRFARCHPTDSWGFVLYKPLMRASDREACECEERDGNGTTRDRFQDGPLGVELFEECNSSRQAIFPPAFNGSTGARDARLFSPILIGAISEHVAINEESAHRGIGREWMNYVRDVPTAWPRRSRSSLSRWPS